MELLQQEAVELPLAFGLLVVQQRALLTGLPAHSGQREDRHSRRCDTFSGDSGHYSVLIRRLLE